MLFNSYNVHLDQQFSLENCNTTTQFHQQFSSTKQFTAYSAILTKKFGFSFIQLSYLSQVNNFKLLNSKERKFKQNKQEISKNEHQVLQRIFYFIEFFNDGILGIEREKRWKGRQCSFFTP